MNRFIVVLFLSATAALPLCAQGNIVKKADTAVKAATAANATHRSGVQLFNAVERSVTASRLSTRQPSISVDQGLDPHNLPPKIERHSIAPSAVVTKLDPTSAMFIEQARPKPVQDIPITQEQRESWREMLERIAPLARIEPDTSLKAIDAQLRHMVPGATLSYLQGKYKALLEEIDNVRREVMPKALYAAIDVNARLPIPQELSYINSQLYTLIYHIDNLLKSMPDEPFLNAQKEYWVTVFEKFNPMLAGQLSHLDTIPRPDRRAYNYNEFNLQNPDGTDYVLPRAESLIVDPDEEMSEWEIMMRMKNPPIKPQDADAERAELLAYIPDNLRIAFINDDAAPRYNFLGWAKNGYLGNNAKLDTFVDGTSFMKQIKQGARYDLVITDLLVPDGGVAMMKDFRKLDNQAVVIAASKYDRGEAGGQTLFDAGMDGYLWYNSNLNEGAYGYIEYLRAMKNYFYYRDHHRWAR